MNDEDCCTSPPVLGGTFERSNDPAFPATVSDFRLDRFEVTVGRFRRFVEAYPASAPATGDGAHPLIQGSDWDPFWDTQLPEDALKLRGKLDCSVDATSAATQPSKAASTARTSPARSARAIG